MQVFNALDQAKTFLFDRQRAYQEVFKDSLSLNEVMKDLENFCRANETTFHDDPRAHALLEGRREVYLRIQEHLKLSSDQLWKKYSNNQTTKGGNL